MEDVIGAEALNSMTNPQVALRDHLTNENRHKLQFGRSIYQGTRQDQIYSVKEVILWCTHQSQDQEEIGKELLGC